eukprot:178267_1
MCEWDHDNIHLTNTDRPDTMSHEEMLDEGIQFGSCSFEIRSSSQPISQTFSECVVAPKGVTNWKPSLGLDGRFCECFKPNMNGDVAPQLTVTQQQLQEKKDVLQLQTKTEQTTEENTRKTIELYASDFEDGKYRITSPGNYIVMEDIVFDFNAPPKDTVPQTISRTIIIGQSIRIASQAQWKHVVRMFWGFLRVLPW